MAATKSRIPFVPKASQLPTSTSSSKSIPSPAASVSHQPVSQDAVFKQKVSEIANVDEGVCNQHVNMFVVYICSY